MPFGEIYNSPNEKRCPKKENISGKNVEEPENRQEAEVLSIAHNLTIECADSEISARQINNSIHLSNDEQNILARIAAETGSRFFNIPAGNISKLSDGTLNSSEVVINPRKCHSFIKPRFA